MAGKGTTDDALAAYRARRDFGRTGEPAAPAAATAHASASPPHPLQFFVQRHAARRLHYDFRLELDGVLKSWAIPKGPSLDPVARRLAVQVEDHPLAYGSFSGRIPAGQYGAGEVGLWDRGTWTPRGDAHAGLATGHLHFTLTGHRLAGEWVLVHAGKDPSQWLLRKLADEHVLRGHQAEEDAAPLNLRDTDASADAASAAMAALPERVEAQLARAVDAPPGGNHAPGAAPRWAYEIKLDGYRMLARCQDSDMRLQSRNGNDWSARLAPLVRQLAALQLHGAWLDGEIAVTLPDGRTRFSALQHCLTHDVAAIRYHLFDVLWWQGRDVRDLPLAARWRLLDQCMLRVPPGSALVRSIPVAFDGALALAAACRLGLEGLIGKRQDAPYRAGRGRANGPADWVKLKCRLRQEFVIGGYSAGKGARTGFGALLLGAWSDARTLQYRGRVGSGFDERQLRDLRRRLDVLASPTCPFPTRPPAEKDEQLHWVRPLLVAEVEFTGWTGAGVLRHPVFAGLREDKDAREVCDIMEAAVNTASDSTDSTDSPDSSDSADSKSGNLPGRSSDHEPGQGTVSASATGAVAGIPITHATRVILADPATTKLDLARYYEAVAPVLLPWLQRRPLTLLRCPAGNAGACFVQKHMADPLPAGIRRTDDEDLYITGIGGLIGLIQNGVVELHNWGARLPHADKPDLFILDLDPDPVLPWTRLVEDANLARTLLEELGFAPRLKTTGGKGLHLVVPIRRTRDWPAVKAFTRGLALHLERVIPQRFTAALSKTRRHERVFVDYLRNARGATAVAPWSVRAQPGAPVATPITWDELDPKTDLRAAWFNIRNVPRRIALEQPDPWGDLSAAARAITRAMEARIGVERAGG